MRRLLVKIGAWLAILLGLAMMLQPTAADWLTRQRNSKTAQQFAANTATAADAANTDSASQTAEESRLIQAELATYRKHGVEANLDPRLTRSWPGAVYTAPPVSFRAGLFGLGHGPGTRAPDEYFVAD